MPELPEVETIVRSLAPKLAGRRILSAEYLSQLVLGGQPAPPLENQRIRGLRRHGKYIVFDLDSGVMTIHLRMTGKLLLNGARTPYTRACFALDRGALLFDDVRQFGRITFSAQLPARIAKLGPDPLEVSLADFRRLLAARRGRIKPLLLDQRFLRGLGNIYVDEALHRAGIHPRAVAARLSLERSRRLHGAIVRVLQQAIKVGGSSISDYVDAEGRAGMFQFEHRVYGRAGEPCKKCGAAIRRIVVTQRGTHYCPRCQRM